MEKRTCLYSSSQGLFLAGNMGWKEILWPDTSVGIVMSLPISDRMTYTCLSEISSPAQYTLAHSLSTTYVFIVRIIVTRRGRKEPGRKGGAPRGSFELATTPVLFGARTSSSDFH